ncbi:MAG TPA: tyrosine-type recombinase/integrase, partial [Smithella sp.]|nr:tyrosine-type recombinase/integrase [Smithella sp.]
MGNMIRDFQTYLDVEKNVSEHTKTAYIADIQEFARFLVEQQFVRQPDEIISTQPETLRHYLAVLYKKKMKKVTVNRKIASLRAFFKYLMRTGKIDVNPAEMVQSLKTEKYIPTFLSVDEMLEVLNAQRDNSFSGLRDRAMLEVFYSCGLRLSELAGLDVADIDFNQKLVKVRGKGRKERIVPVGDPALKALTDYLEKARLIRTKSEPG